MSKRPASRRPSVKPKGALRKPLSGGVSKLFLEGDPQQCKVLRAAFSASEGRADLLTHGFHSYPARMHCLTARVLLERLAEPRQSVLDPFCGGGTVPVEAMLRGCKAVGSDLNPLAIRVAEVKTELRGSEARKRFLSVLQAVAEASERRVRERVPIRAKVPKAEVQWYEPHTLMELAGLLREIHAVPNPRDQRALEVLFSAIVGKFAQQRSDTSVATQSKRIRKGLPTEFFHRRGRELVRRWEALEEAVLVQQKDHKVIAPKLMNKDVRALPSRLRGVHWVITSPPYPGVYDYVDHHQRRMAWLGINRDEFRRREIGARRRQWNPEAQERWEQELLDTLRTIAGLLRNDGHAILLLGDGRFGRKPVASKEMVRELASKAGMHLSASVTNQPAAGTGLRARAEHLLWLSKARRSRR